MADLEILRQFPEGMLVGRDRSTRYGVRPVGFPEVPEYYHRLPTIARGIRNRQPMLGVHPALQEAFGRQFAAALPEYQPGFDAMRTSGRTPPNFAVGTYSLPYLTPPSLRHEDIEPPPVVSRWSSSYGGWHGEPAATAIAMGIRHPGVSGQPINDPAVIAGLQRQIRERIYGLDQTAPHHMYSLLPMCNTEPAYCGEFFERTLPPRSSATYSVPMVQSAIDRAGHTIRSRPMWQFISQGLGEARGILGVKKGGYISNKKRKVKKY